MNCYVVELKNEKGDLHLLSPFSLARLRKAKWKSENYIGQLREPAIGVVPGNIAYNKDFLVHMHVLVRDVMINDPQVQEKAKEQLNGFVFIIDRRSPATMDTANEHVDKEDIIGIFLCNDHKTDVSKYRPNPDYVLISEKGIAQLPLAVEEKLDELELMEQ